MRLDDHPVLRFKRPIYGVLVFFGIAVVAFAVLYWCYLNDKRYGSVSPTTVPALWGNGVVILLTAGKLIWDLLNPATRRWMFSKRTEQPVNAENLQGHDRRAVPLSDATPSEMDRKAAPTSQPPGDRDGDTS